MSNVTIDEFAQADSADCFSKEDLKCIAEQLNVEWKKSWTVTRAFTVLKQKVCGAEPKSCKDLCDEDFENLNLKFVTKKALLAFAKRKNITVRASDGKEALLCKIKECLDVDGGDQLTFPQNPLSLSDFNAEAYQTNLMPNIDLLCDIPCNPTDVITIEHPKAPEPTAAAPPVAKKGRVATKANLTKKQKTQLLLNPTARVGGVGPIQPETVVERRPVEPAVERIELGEEPVGQDLSQSLLGPAEEEVEEPEIEEEPAEIEALDIQTVPGRIRENPISAIEEEESAEQPAEQEEESVEDITSAFGAITMQSTLSPLRVNEIYAMIKNNDRDGLESMSINDWLAFSSDYMPNIYPSVQIAAAKSFQDRKGDIALIVGLLLNEKRQPQQEESYEEQLSEEDLIPFTNLEALGQDTNVVMAFFSL